MQEFFLAVMQHAFMQQALLVGLLSSLAAALTGTFVVIKRLSYLAGGLAHATLGGMGMAYYWGYSPLLGGVVFAVLAAVVMGGVRFYFQENEDTLISALWAMGMAVGILFLYRTPGYTADLSSFLFGNILMISKASLYGLIALDVLLLAFFFIFYRQFISISFDEDFARLRGLPVVFLYIFLLCLVAITILILVSSVGLILVIALITLPVSSLKTYVSSPGQLMGAAFVLSLGLMVGGLWISFLYNLPTGPVIILLCGSFYLVSLMFGMFSRFLQD